MRLTRLALERYGHVSGEWLEFPAAFGLHVVLGANEAGKSTALEAVADGLFGFPTRGRSRLSHPDDPRVGFTLRSADGTEASFVRRKTGREKLLDGSGAPLPEAALARFLGGNGRERFQEVFGLNAERLRQSGRTIMAEQGEAGAAILQAQTGLRGLRATVDYLDEEAKQLFGDGRGQRRISAAVAVVKENRKLVAERSVSGPDYLRVHAREADLEQQLKRIDEERQALRTEQARLTRVRSTAPFRTELAELAAKLEAIGPAVPLPPDASTLYVTAVSRRDQAARDRLREEGEVEVIGAKLGQLEPDRSILREAAAITSLEADLSRIADAKRDYLRVSGQATASVAAADEFARRLGVAERGAALRERLPDVVTRRAAATLLGRYALDVAARNNSEEALKKLEQEAEDAEQALSECSAMADAERLRDAVEEAQNAGLIDADLAKAAGLRDKVAAEAERSLVKLALWTGDLAALEATSVPLEAEASRLGTVLEDATARRDDTESELDRHDAAAETCQVEMRGIEAMGSLPTEDAVAAVRARRDLAWRLVRHAITNGGSPPAPEAWAGETLTPADLPSHFETLLREADAMADARHGELARVQKWERLREQAADLTNQRPGLLNAREAARQHAHSAQIAWSKAWTPAGIEPLSPAAMREWVRDRAAVLTAAATARDAAEAYGRVAKRQAYLRDSLSSVLPSSGGADLAPMLRDAFRTLRQLDQQAAERAAAAERVTRAAKNLTDAKRARHVIDERGRHWVAEWEPVAERLGLPPDADPNATTDLLAIWLDLDKELDRERGFQGRLTEMRGAIDEHDAVITALAKRLEVPVTETLVTDLAERRRHAEKVAAEQTRLERAGAEHAEAIVGHQRAEAAAEAQLSALRKSAGVEDEAGLKVTIEAESLRAELTRRQQDRGAALRGLSDGRTEAEMAAEATALDIDTIPGRLEAILARTTTLDAEASARTGELVHARQELRTMQAGQDVAGPAQAVHDSLAAIEDDAHRYVRLRLAHALLRGGIDRYRRSQQGPLLAKASALFAELTAGRYTRLEQDESEKGEPFLVAVRPDGSICPAGSLSEGTTDQLFLALRLASIALDAAASEPMPFIADDLLVNFDDARAAAALSLLAEFGRTSQVILFTHHKHLLDLLAPGTASIHDLPRDLAAL